MRLFGIQIPAGLDPAVRACRDHFRLAAGLSALVNVLYLAPTLYMMQVYDRAVPTAGTATLLWLTIVVACALATLSVLDALRARVLARASIRLDQRLAKTILDNAFGQRILRGKVFAPQSAMREFDNLRTAISGAPMIAMFDIAWTPIYIVVAFVLHPAIGGLAVLTSAALLAVNIANERANRGGGIRALQGNAAAYLAQDRITQRAELVRALGMREAMTVRLLAERDRALQFVAQQQFATGRYASSAKFLRLLSQSVALGLGAWLAILHQISTGSIIAASVLISRALQPIELLIGGWAGIVQARQAVETLGGMLEDSGTASHVKPFELPAPKGNISVRELTVEAPDRLGRPLLSDIAFDVKAGEFIGLIGPSGAGKSTLARVLVGALAPDAGVIRIDGADMQDWDADRLARHVGYLPQDAGLLPGSIADNISRFARLRAESQAVVTQQVLQATSLAGVHDMIVGLPGGYDRMIGWNADELSVGQRQRIALARALYDNPVVLVLDEPNSALDAEGENALTKAIATVRATGTTVFMATHRAPLLADATRLLLLAGGTISMMGTYNDVLAALQRPVVTPVLGKTQVQ